MASGNSTSRRSVYRTRNVCAGALVLLVLLGALALKRERGPEAGKKGLAAVLTGQIDGASRDQAAWLPDQAGQPLGVAFSADGIHYAAFLRRARCQTPSGRLLPHFECRLTFTRNDPGPPAYVLWPETSGSCDAAEPLLSGLGDWEGYVFAYYDKGALCAGAVRIASCRADRVRADIDWSVSYATADGIRTECAGSALRLEPATQAKGQAVLAGLGLRVDTQRWQALGLFLDELRSPRYRLALYREAPTLAPDPERVTVFVRHDMDRTMYGAHAIARAEREHGVRSTWFINMASSIYALTAPEGRYVRRTGAVADLLAIQAHGQEIGYHTDILMMALFFDTPFKAWLDVELGRLRRAGIRLDSQAENGSPYARTTNSYNGYSWKDFRRGGDMEKAIKDRTNGFDGVVTYERDGRPCRYEIPDVSLRDAGLSVSAYRVREQLPFNVADWAYISDGELETGSTPADLLARLRALPPGAVAAILLHPVHWTTIDPAFDLTTSILGLPSAPSGQQSQTDAAAGASSSVQGTSSAPTPPAKEQP